MIPTMICSGETEHVDVRFCNACRSAHRNDRTRKGVCLNRSTNTERSDRSEHCEQDAQNLAKLLALEAALQCIHSTTKHVPVVILNAIFHCDERF